MEKKTIRYAGALCFAGASFMGLGCGPGGSGDMAAAGNDLTGVMSGDMANPMMMGDMANPMMMGDMANPMMMGDMTGPPQPDMTGSGTVDCVGQAKTICMLQSKCTPEQFTLSWESESICESETTKNCMAGQMAGSAGIMDPTGCFNATYMSDCDGYFTSLYATPAACKYKNGTVAEMGACKFQSDCMVGANCIQDPNQKPGCGSICIIEGVAGDPCTTDVDCDVKIGLKCAFKFDKKNGKTMDNSTCQMATYGALNADCFDTTQMRCANGFQCVNANRTCSPVAAAGAPCDSANTAALCDLRKFHTCQKNDQGNMVCTAPLVANIGGQCGVIMKETYKCSNYAICNNSNPSKCEARVALGQPCTATPNNCYLYLQCKATKCQPFDPPSC